MHEIISIGEAAERAGLAASTLRYYEREGLIISTRSPGGQRQYRREVLRRLTFIVAAQRVGLSLDEVRSALDRLPEGRTPTKADWARLSREWRPRLDAEIEYLRKLRDELTDCIGCGCLSFRACALYNPGDRAHLRGTGPSSWSRVALPPLVGTSPICRLLWAHHEEQHVRHHPAEPSFE